MAKAVLSLIIVASAYSAFISGSPDGEYLYLKPGRYSTNSNVHTFQLTEDSNHPSNDGGADKRMDLEELVQTKFDRRDGKVQNVHVLVRTKDDHDKCIHLKRRFQSYQGGNELAIDPPSDSDDVFLKDHFNPFSGYYIQPNEPKNEVPKDDVKYFPVSCSDGFAHRKKGTSSSDSGNDVNGNSNRNGNGKSGRRTPDAAQSGTEPNHESSTSSEDEKHVKRTPQKKPGSKGGPQSKQHHSQTENGHGTTTDDEQETSSEPNKSVAKTKQDKRTPQKKPMPGSSKGGPTTKQHHGSTEKDETSSESNKSVAKKKQDKENKDSNEVKLTGWRAVIHSILEFLQKLFPFIHFHKKAAEDHHKKAEEHTT